MAQKKLEPSSDFEKYDLDADGVVSDEEITRAKEIRETGKANYDYMTIDTIKSVPDTVTKVLFLGGEPLSTKRHLELLKLIKDPSPNNLNGI